MVRCGRGRCRTRRRTGAFRRWTCLAAAARGLCRCAGRRGNAALVLLGVGHYQRPLLTATEYAAREADQQQKLREFHDGKYTRAAACRRAGTSVNAFQSNTLLKAEVFMRISKTLAAVLAIAACGASGAAFADNPIGFYVGAGAGESQIRSDDSYYGYPGYYNDYQFAWQGLVGIRPIRMLGLEATYIDFGQPYRHNGRYDFNVSGSDSHPTAPRFVRRGLPAVADAIHRRLRQGGRCSARHQSHRLRSAALRSRRPVPLLRAHRSASSHQHAIRVRCGRAIQISVWIDFAR